MPRVGVMLSEAVAAPETLMFQKEHEQLACQRQQTGCKTL